MVALSNIKSRSSATWFRLLYLFFASLACTTTWAMVEPATKPSRTSISVSEMGFLMVW